MLSLRRRPETGGSSEDSIIDIKFKDESVTLTLNKIQGGLSIWRISSTDWGSEKYPPSIIALANNQALTVNDWLKIYGSKITEDGQAVMHLSAPREVIIERRDRASYNDN